MKINFEKLKVKSLSGVVTEIDSREGIAEIIYDQTHGLKYKLLAEKIYKSTGVLELDETELNTLNSLLDTDFFVNKITDAIRDNLVK
ncbi:hypothetical protein [Gabonibacter massiliensis]|uniref:hypothetical protein n=1 Tax=Gabonibacter massiliensis TaxID=1720195 RepID=UPI00073E1B42|nr:hypothetical protein [Gabonibacter massiliensis]